MWVRATEIRPGQPSVKMGSSLSTDRAVWTISSARDVQDESSVAARHSLRCSRLVSLGCLSRTETFYHKPLH